MTGKDALALEEEGHIRYNDQRGEYELVDDDGIFIETVEVEESNDLHEEMRDKGHSLTDFYSHV